jgi:hypothetical protein
VPTHIIIRNTSSVKKRWKGLERESRNAKRESGKAD